MSSASLALVQNVRKLYAWQSNCLYNIDGLVARRETVSRLTLAKEQLAGRVVSNKLRSLCIVEHTHTHAIKYFCTCRWRPAPNSRLILIVSVTWAIYHLAIIKDNVSRSGSSCFLSYAYTITSKSLPAR